MLRNSGVLDVLSDGEIGEMMLRRGAKLQSDSNRMLLVVSHIVCTDYGVWSSTVR